LFATDDVRILCDAEHHVMLGVVRIFYVVVALWYSFYSAPRLAA